MLLQGFHWTSWRAGAWYRRLQGIAGDAARAGFTDVWLPPPCHSASPEGYLPGRYYDLDTPYGTRSELAECVAAFGEAGVRCLADLVLNHRCLEGRDEDGKWTNFSASTRPCVEGDEECESYISEVTDWGKWVIAANDGIVSGSSDGPELAAVAPDLDHENPELRAALTDWLGWLRSELGFAGWRLDFARGFGAEHAARYVQDSVGPDALSVAEYWADASWRGPHLEYDQDRMRQVMCDWIDAVDAAADTRICAFDFGTKVVLQEAVRNDEYWRLRDSNGSPPGLIGWWPERAVTFIENHDTGFECNGQGHWAFPPGKEEIGYAYILSHPGVPSVFFPHVYGCKPQGPGEAGGDCVPDDLAGTVRALLAARRAAGVSAGSKVQILCADADLYFARVEGERGALCVKLGPRYDIGPLDPSHAAEEPAELVCCGEGFAVWAVAPVGAGGGGAAAAG